MDTICRAITSFSPESRVLIWLRGFYEVVDYRTF